MASTIRREANPSMADLPLVISTSGVNGPNASLPLFLNIGISEAAEKRRKVRIIPVGASEN